MGNLQRFFLQLDIDLKKKSIKFCKSNIRYKCDWIILSVCMWWHCVLIKDILEFYARQQQTLASYRYYLTTIARNTDDRLSKGLKGNVIDKWQKEKVLLRDWFYN